MAYRNRLHIGARFLRRVLFLGTLLLAAWLLDVFNLRPVFMESALVVLAIFVLFMVAVFLYPFALMLAGVEFFQNGHGEIGFLIILFGIKEFFSIYGRDSA